MLFIQRSNTRCLTIAGVLSLLLLSGCGSMPMTRALQQNPADIPTTLELIETPFFAQAQYQCGPAALATVFNFYGVNVTPDQLTPLVYIPEKHGSLQTEMVATTRYYGLLPYPLQPQLKNILLEVAAHHPVLVMQNLSFAWLPDWHYAVVVGYDLKTQMLVLRSGTTKQHEISFATFERTWQRANYWALVIVPTSQTPYTADSLTFLNTVHDMEVTQHETALRAYQTATKKWPNDALTWLSLGNAYYANKQFAQANTTFSKGLTQNPTPELWNNYAYSLMASHCPQEAQQALACGLKHFTKNENLLQSRQELRLIKSKQGVCPAVKCP